MFSRTPRIKKWPFVVKDFLFLALAGGLFAVSGFSLEGWNLAILVACVGLGACFGVFPFLAEYRVESRRFDAYEFRATLEQVRQLENVGELVSAAAKQWRDMQDHGESAAKAAEEMAAQVQAEGKRFREIIEKVDTREHEHLRIEAEKLRRNEREWLEVLVGVMDHVFALHRAANRSGQAQLIQQLNGFQNACLDICRRVGLSQHTAKAGEPFNPKLHKIIEERPMPENPTVQETLAPGFSFQGRPIRLPMVAVKAAEPKETTPEEESKNNIS